MLKQIPKSEKNSEMGGWVKPRLGFLFFFGNIVFFCVVSLVSLVLREALPATCGINTFKLPVWISSDFDDTNPHNAEIFLCKPWRPKGFSI